MIKGIGYATMLPEENATILKGLYRPEQMSSLKSLPAYAFHAVWTKKHGMAFRFYPSPFSLFSLDFFHRRALSWHACMHTYHPPLLCFTCMGFFHVPW